jgi:ankyrin repeat protein
LDAFVIFLVGSVSLGTTSPGGTEVHPVVEVAVPSAGAVAKSLRALERRQFRELLRAVERSDVGRVRTLLARGADPNGRHAGDEHAPTDRPIVTAAAKGDVSIVDILLAAGANPNWCCCSCVTALHRAIKGKHTQVVARLLDAGANPRLLYEGSKAPIELAKESGELAIIELLEKKLSATKAPSNSPLQTDGASPRR